MKNTNYRNPNKKNTEKPKQTSPAMKRLYLSIYRSGYEQGAIDLFNGKIRVERDENGYFLSRTDEETDSGEKETK